MKTYHLFSIALLFCCFSKLSAQQIDYPDELAFLEFGTGYAFAPDSEFPHIPIYAKWVYELNQHYEFGGRFQTNMIRLGKSYPDFSSPFQNPQGMLNESEKDVFKNMVSLSAFGLKRFRILKKNRFIGLGMEINSSKSIQDLVRNDTLTRFESIKKPIAFGINLIWQERWRNFIHQFNFYMPVSSPSVVSDNLNESGEWYRKNYFTYTVGYRFPFVKLEGEDHEDLIWKSITKDTTRTKFNFGLGGLLRFPVNFGASAPAFDFYGEISLRTSAKYAYGLRGTSFSLSDLGHLGYDKGLTLKYTTSEKLNSASQISSLHFFSDYFFNKTEIDLFAGAGLGVYYRKGMIPQPVFNGKEFVSQDLLPKRWNPGGFLRAGYQIGNFKHSISFNYTGKNIPDFFSTTLGYHFGFSKKVILK